MATLPSCRRNAAVTECELGHGFAMLSIADTIFIDSTCMCMSCKVSIHSTLSLLKLHPELSLEP